jgi:hypothetical protein
MKNLSIKTVQTILLCVILSLICEGCSARTPKKQNFIMKEMINPVVKDSLGDSICNIIVSSEKVKVERLTANQSLSEKVPTKWLSKKETGVATFLLMANDSITHPSPVFGKYSPNVKFTFFSKKRFVVVEVDFGLQQVCYIGEETKKFDLRDSYLLKFCNMLFPNDEYLSFLLKERTK